MGVAEHSPGCDLRHSSAQPWQKVCWQILLVGNFRRPLAVAGLEKMIDVDADAEDPARVDLHLVQVHGRMRTDPEAGLVEVARLEELDDLLSTRCPPGHRPET